MVEAQDAGRRLDGSGRHVKDNRVAVKKIANIFDSGDVDAKRIYREMYVSYCSCCSIVYYITIFIVTGH